jgi:cytochrome o ubiquinol oxidase subunit III
MNEPTIAGTKRLPAQDPESRTMFGFWLYLMTDFVLFSVLFAVYAVLHANTFGGPGPTELFSLPYVLAETLILLTSSFTCGLATIALQRQRKQQVFVFFALTFLLGAAFLGLELREFHQLAAEGNSWHRSGFLSGFFTLVGTHGLHITAGLAWMAVLLFRLKQRGFTRLTVRQLTLLSLFWHFLDVVWIFIFTIVYLFGVAQV